MQKPSTLDLTLSSRTVGLFGTCGGSAWREPFKAVFADKGIPFFDPQVENWTPECAVVEAWHLANDQLILFPVTAETFGFGSLAETGFSIQTVLATGASHRFVILLIEPEVSTELQDSSPEQASASQRARKLALAHLAQVLNPNVFVAESLEDMLTKSLQLFAVQDILASIRSVKNK